MIHATISGYIVSMAESIPADYGAHAALVEEFDLDHLDRSAFYLAVQRLFDWPFLCVAQRYSPAYNAGSFPSILLVPETHILFVGAGERLLAYNLRGPDRLWEDSADMGFHDWQRHDEVILMKAELELAAWDISGRKLWSAFAEPPSMYHVEMGEVYLDVMGAVSSFPLLTGPIKS
ncbi:MAG TPA: hypothetical protein VF510_16230 [Ktedonobacterales bacterium]